MKQGYLSQYFSGVSIKTLSAVEVNAHTSNQHEFNGVKDLKGILGEPDGKMTFPSKFIYLTDSDETPPEEEGFLTWYDARQRAREERGVKRWEYRLYFPSNTPMQLANQGDLLLIAKKPDNTLLAIIVESETTIAHQIQWLFGFCDTQNPEFSTREELETEQDRIGYASRVILESIGIQIEEKEENFLDEMLGKFGQSFPATREFSQYARNTLSDISVVDDYDGVLMSWLEREEILFRTLEKHFIGERLSKGFSDSVDDFISYSLSVQNRRKSRAGLALENHLEYLFKDLGLKYTRNGLTEGKSKPDFIFPSIENYHDKSFSSTRLTMLGVKSSCKDRWRQVLSESERVNNKHLLTLEAAISTNQTNEMKSKCLQLVVPARIQPTYTLEQQVQLINLSDFISEVSKKEKINCS